VGTKISVRITNTTFGFRSFKGPEPWGGADITCADESLEVRRRVALPDPLIYADWV